MGQVEFDNFRNRIKDWMDRNQDEYDFFEEEINKKDSTVYQTIMSKAISLVPLYQKIIRKKANQGMYDDISDIETLFTENKVAESLIKEFDKANEKSIVPALLSWLYFGKSFERMVERGEEMRRSSDTNYIQKLVITATIKILIAKSISLGLRSKSDWQEHRRLMKLADSDHVMNWAIDNTVPEEKKKVGRKRTEKTFEEVLSILVEDKTELLNRIEEYLITKHTDLDLARLKIALDELYYIEPCDIKLFRDALAQQYQAMVTIVGERGIQKKYRDLNSFLPVKEVFMKDFGEDRNVIDKLKDFLRN
ncbi:MULTISPECIES: DUF6043 family protein [Dysgonomonas]|uniref:DUF6043 family protein n=1 Tax=Dysgonomonas TaxID=156973 RepID=UPI00092B465E|nr:MULTISPECIES: DUF6043 family protein [Dysgonomonas]MBN9302271.1 hypothetical protein [Dysgonomonas mossii]OJX63596.1 MAG: hypothetical protein BGO84_12770 [Dysgonomonas sp. 37-18]